MRGRSSACGSRTSSSPGEVWPLNVGQVYTTLQRLERDGLVETDDAEGERSRKRYITSKGHRELAECLRTPPDLDRPSAPDASEVHHDSA